jgi:hypothetical protein
LDLRGRRLEKTALEGASQFELLIKFYSDDKMKEDKMSWACGMYVGNERCIQERYHLEDLVVDGRKILRLIFKKYYVTAWPAVFKQDTL